jgi:Transposase
VGNGSGVSRGDRNRNARLARLRALVPVSNAIVGIDLADAKQMVVVTDHDWKVLARKIFRCRAWDLGAALDWAAERAGAKGWAGVTVACEPTGHRWRVLGQLAADRLMPFVCVQPMLSSWARRSEDLTSDKTDEKDAVLIARLTAQLRCYVPEPVDATWGRLRHLGARREQLVVEMVSQIQQIRALLECVWPAALDTARQPFRSRTWAAAMAVICQREGGEFARTRRLGAARFEQAVRREIRHRPRPGQARRSRPAGKAVRYVRRSHQAHRPRPTRAAPGRLARGLGHPARQCRLCGPLPAPDHAGDQQAHRDPSPNRDRRGDPAPAARCDQHRPTMGSTHRHPRHRPPQTGAHCRLILRRGVQAGGRGEPHAALSNHGSPRRTSWAAPPVVSPTRLHADGTKPHHRYAGTDDGRGTDQELDTTALR